MVTTAMAISPSHDAAHAEARPRYRVATAPSDDARILVPDTHPPPFDRALTRSAMDRWTLMPTKRSRLWAREVTPDQPERTAMLPVRGASDTRATQEAAFLRRENTNPPTSSSLTPFVSGTKRKTKTSEMAAKIAYMP